MSVTFYPAVGSVLTQVTCSCGDKVDETVFESHTDAYMAVYELKSLTVPQCGDDFCAAYGASFTSVDVIPEVNFSNVNAVDVLDVLGIQVGESFEDRCVGSMSGEDFLGRVLMASAVQLADAGRPTFREGNMIYGGRSAGYMNDAVLQLQEVAEYAVAHNFEITWS